MTQLNYRKKIFIFSESRSEFFLLKETYNLLKKKYDVQFIIAGFINSKKFENNLKTIDSKTCLNGRTLLIGEKFFPSPRPADLIDD